MIKLKRETRETSIDLKLNLRGEGSYKIQTDVGFFDHMLELWAKHGFFDLEIKVAGDLKVGPHHTVEDTAIVLGQAIDRELKDRRGIKRYGDIILPMDECLIMSAVDLSGRSYYESNFDFSREKVGDFPVELLDEFFEKLTSHGRFVLHFHQFRGGNAHHLIEASFKSFARALDSAVCKEERLGDSTLSTKGKLGEGGRH